MDKPEFQPSKEAAWRSRLQRYGQSGKSIAAFCRDEAVSKASFHNWRTKLANDEPATPPAHPTPFIDLGSIKQPVGMKRATPSAASIPPALGIDIRIDLAGGIVLTITRR